MTSTYHIILTKHNMLCYLGILILPDIDVFILINQIHRWMLAIRKGPVGPNRNAPWKSGRGADTGHLKIEWTPNQIQ